MPNGMSAYDISLSQLVHLVEKTEGFIETYYSDSKNHVALLKKDLHAIRNDPVYKYNTNVDDNFLYGVIRN